MKKIRIPLFTALCITGIALLLVFSHFFDPSLFRHTADAFFESSLEHDALGLHFTLSEPERFGIRPADASLPVYSEQSRQASIRAQSALLTRLSRLNHNRLNEQDRYAFDLLTSYLALELEGASYPFYEEPLSPSAGSQSELLLLLAEYTLSGADDAEAYLSLLSSVPDYLQGLAGYERQKSAAGLFMPDADARETARQCQDIITAEALVSGTHFLQTTFHTRLDALCQSGQLSDAQKKEYLARNDRLLSECVLPAYQELAESLLSLCGTGRYEGGLAEKPDGRDYYAWLVRHTTGSALSPESMYSLLQKTFQKKYGEMKAVLSKYRLLTGNMPDYSLLSEGFPVSDPSGILNDLQKRMAQDFPDLSSLCRSPVSCTVKNVDAALEAYTSPAFYMTPPLDDPIHNTICINRSSTSPGIELYTTLAHEGYPGHLYQTVYSSLYAASQNDIKARRLLSYGGYVEGWAYYTEQLSYEYAAQLLDGADSDSAAALLCRLVSLQRDLQINLFSLLDLSLHYYGASRQDVVRSLESFGLPEETAQKIYDYLRTSPAVYLKYYVGYLEMTALRERARALWGEDFTPERFHRFVLEAGPSDFTNLTRRLKLRQKDGSGTPDVTPHSLTTPPY